MTTKKVEPVEPMTDPGDKISASLSFKKNLGNYQSMDFYSGVSITKRESETDEEAWQRAWAIVERELEAQVDKAEKLLAANG